MKILLKFILFFLFVITQHSFGQEYPTQADKERYISYLDSSDNNIHGQGIDAIRFYHITEAIPAIEERFWKKNESKQSLYLRVLVELGASSVESFALAYIDSADNDTSDWALLKKVRATRELFLIGNFSTINYYWEWLEEYKNGKYKPDVGFLHALPEIIRNSPSPEDVERAKAESIYYVQNSRNEGVRYTLITSLANIYGNEMIPLLLEISKKDKSSGNRYAAYEELVKLNYSDLHNYTKERLYSEQEPLYREFHADTLLVRFGTPKDYKYVSDYLNQEPDSDATFGISVGLAIFEPPLPDTTAPTSTMLDTLTSYTNQCHGYDWLKDEAYKNELLNKIETAKNYLSSADSVNCAIEMQKFQNNVAEVYADSAGSYPKYISEEGYKFLYYYSSYIIERLPEPAEGLPVKPEGSLLQSSSLKHNNKKKRK